MKTLKSKQHDNNQRTNDMKKEFDNREKKGRTCLICLGTFACHLGREIDKMGIENMHVWLMDGNAGDFLSSCIHHSQTEDRFILLVACGGKTGSKLTSTSIVELEKWNLKFSAIAVLPSLLEGGVNIVRAIRTAERLHESAKRTFFIENCYPLTDEPVTVKQGMEMLTFKVHSLVNSAVLEIDRQDEMGTFFFDYQEKAMKHEKVLYSLGCMFKEGSIVKKDVTKAFEYFQKAANIGSAAAWCNLGIMHEENKNYPNAMNAYMNAAYKGDAEGSCRLARMYEDSIGVDKDDSMALNWYIKAARLHHPEGILKFACFLLDGKGVEQNRLLGLKNLRIAAETGYQPAREELVRRLREDRTRNPGLRINQKLSILVIESGFSTRMYATKIGYPFNRFQQILDGKTEVDVPLLQAIIKSYPNTDLKYLLGGE